MAKARVASKHPHVQKTLTHLGDHKHQPETPSTVAVVPSDSSDTHFACDASIDVYKYAQPGSHQKNLSISISVALGEIPTAICEPSEIATWKRLKFRRGT